MASEEEQKMDGAVKGFAGLSSMVSDVDAAVTHAEKERPEPTRNDAPVGGSRPVPQPASEPEPSHEPYQQTAQPSGDPSARKWLIGISAVIGLVWLVTESGNKSTAPAPAWPPREPVQPQAPSRPMEERPLVGTNLLHGPAQLRYCLAEHIRLDAAQGAVNNYGASDVERFNAMVLDYNSRCANFRYRRGSLESAGSDVERFRQTLESEGRSRFTQPPQRPSYSTSQAPVDQPTPSPTNSQALVYQPTPSPTGPDSALREIQQRLNTLGYDAGSPDGLEGSKTRFAITAFQKDYGIYPDGVASTEVLAALVALSPTCRHKAVMSDADYRACGISLPQLN